MLGFLSFSAALWLLLAARRTAGRARWLRFAGAALVFALGLTTVPGVALWSKVVARLVLPAGLVFCALWVATLVLAHERRALAATGCGALLLLHAIAGNAWLGELLLQRLERPYTEAVPDPLSEGPFDAVFVLGGGTTIDASGRVFLSRSGDRVTLGARLYHAGRTSTLVASGSTPPGATIPRDAAAETAGHWRELGVTDDAILQISSPWNTSGEVREYAALIEERGWDNVAIVTSAWHLRRVEAHMERHQLSATLLPADVRGNPEWRGFETVVPVGAGFELMHRACWEYLGAFVGR